ncbi:GNAT family N-acetyltransferase [Liquorilactobacillus capillatus]|uniref:Gnat family acetyltransferase n=1 Tax=Liquorilactobacillus capillatus DSM 19910 TaxID=1423731 RepID=A0A0R1LZH7_9LACO|nr:GNAT family N-acetyltransferase [Liquorilactobacillus capillatus]KRL01110.1 gnat family acetyltransferase [Liquorilactobacillus capillatus DSM 19910]
MEEKLSFKQIQSLDDIHYQLLLEADPSRKLITDYAQRSTCIVTEVAGELVGIMLLLPTRPETLEIVNIAVTKTRRQQGIGQQMLIYAKSWAKANHYTILEVGTGSTSLGQLYLYQKNGFRIYGVDTDFFIKHYAEPIFENKLRLRDMLRLRLEV